MSVFTVVIQLGAILAVAVMCAVMFIFALTLLVRTAAAV